MSLTGDGSEINPFVFEDYTEARQGPPRPKRGRKVDYGGDPVYPLFWTGADGSRIPLISPPQALNVTHVGGDVKVSAGTTPYLYTLPATFDDVTTSVEGNIIKSKMAAVNNMVAVGGNKIGWSGTKPRWLSEKRIYMITINDISAGTELCFDYNRVWAKEDSGGAQQDSGGAPRKLMAGQQFDANTILGWYQGNTMGSRSHAMEAQKGVIVYGATTPADVVKPNMIFSMANTHEYRYRV